MKEIEINSQSTLTLRSRMNTKGDEGRSDGHGA